MSYAGVVANRPSITRFDNLMKKPMWSGRTLLRYALLQIPGIVLVSAVLLLAVRFLGLPSEWVLLILGLWVAKDVILYPFVWRAYEQPKRSSRRLRERGSNGAGRKS